MASPLDNLCGPGKALRKEAPDANEFAGLKRSGLRGLPMRRSKPTRWKADSTWPITRRTRYAWPGSTFGLGPEVWRVLARCHDVRNRGEHEGDLAVDERLLADLMIEDNLAIPFETTVLGVSVTVVRVQLTLRDEIVAVCRRAGTRQTVPLLDLPLPSPPPAGSEWIAAYRHWLRGG